MADPYSSVDSVYSQAFKRMIDLQRERIKEQLLLDQHIQTRIQEENVKEESHRRHRFSMHSRYQQELVEQIKKDHRKKEIHDQEKQAPGIAEELHGYPHRPQTPRDIRRKREVEKQKEFSRSVSEQQAERLKLKKAAREQELRLVHEIIDMDNREYERQVQAELTRKQKVREELRKAWREADQARQYLHDIEKSVYQEVKSTLMTSVPDEKRETGLSEEKRPEGGRKESMEVEEEKRMATEEVQTVLTEGNIDDVPIPTQLKKKDGLPKDLTLSQIQSLAKFLASSTPKLPVIRQYRANDQSFTSPDKHRVARRVPLT